MAVFKAFVSGLAALSAALGASAETAAEIALAFGRSDAVGQPQLSPDGRYLSMTCAPAVKRSICVFDLKSGAEPVIIPPIADTRLTSHYWANPETLILNVDIFESISTAAGMKDYTFERAIAFHLGDKKPVMLLKESAAGYLDANDLAAVLPGDPDHILIGMTYVRASRNVYETLKVN